MSEKPFNIEELLEQIGSSELPGDVVHRYELRRTLLSSRYFDSTTHRDAMRSRFLAYTVPLFAGTVLVVVFAVAGTAMLELDATAEPHPTIDTSRIMSAAHLSEITYVSAQQPFARVDVAEYIDTSTPPIPLRDTLRFVPMNAMLTSSVQ